MNLSGIAGVIGKTLKQHSPVILSTMAGLGVVTTAYLTGRASYEAALVIREVERKTRTNPDPKERLKERTKLVWKLYIPSGISAISTIACIAGANRAGLGKTLAAQTALAVTERAYSEYRDKVVEELGPRKDQAIHDKVVGDRVKKDPPSQSIISGPGNVLCCELFTGRYFTSDMETMRKAQNELNAKLLKHDYANLDDFYYIIGLQPTSTSNNIGWKSSKLMELEMTAALTEDGRPCLCFEYNYTTLL
jgi:hypothetical protein